MSQAVLRHSQAGEILRVGAIQVVAANLLGLKIREPRLEILAKTVLTGPERAKIVAVAWSQAAGCLGVTENAPVIFARLIGESTDFQGGCVELCRVVLILVGKLHGNVAN